MLFDKYIDKILENNGLTKQAVPASEVFATQVPTMGEYGDDDQRYLNLTYQESWIVYRCVFLIANNIARLPKKIYTKDAKGEKVDVSDNPDFRIFAQPNIFQTPYDFWMESISRLKMQGELFWLKQYGVRESIEALYADWRTEQVKVNPDPKFLIRSYEVDINRTRETFPSEQVFYIRYFNPFSNLRGISPLKAARHEVTLDLNAVSFNKKFFSQGMKTPGILQKKGDLNETEGRRLQQSFMRAYGGLRQMHVPMVLWGDTEFKPLNSVSMKDAEFTLMRGMSRENIAGVFGVPLELLTFSNKTYENVKEAQKVFWQFTLMPEIEKISDLINTFLMPELTTMDAWFEMDLSGVEALQESRSDKLKDLTEGFDRGGVTPNMILEAFNKEPVDNPAMNSFYLPFNVAPIAENPTKAIRLLPGMYQKQASVEDRDKIWEYKAKVTESQERGFITKLKTFFSKQETEVLKNFHKIYKSKKQLEVQGELFDMDKWTQEAAKIGEPFIVEAVRQAGQELMGSDFDLTHPAVRNALGVRVAKYSVDINTTTREKIKKEIREGFANNEDIPTVAKRIKKVFKQARDSRAQLIARTEVVGSSNFGTQQGMVQGNYGRKMWITSRDANVRDSHQIDGQVRNVNESFTLLDGRTMEFPMDFNERCFHVPTQEPRT